MMQITDITQFTFYDSLYFKYLGNEIRRNDSYIFEHFRLHIRVAYNALIKVILKRQLVCF